MTTLKNSKHEAVLQHFVASNERVGWKSYAAVYTKSKQRAAEVAWSRLLKDAEFSDRLNAQLKGIADAVMSAKVMNLTEVLEELTKIGRSDIRNCIVEGDDTADVIQALRDMAPEHSAAVQELTVETYVEGHGDDARDVKRVRLKLHDKRGALNELRRHHEPDRHEHTGKDGAPIATEDKTECTPLELARRVAFALELGRQALALQAKDPQAAAKASPAPRNRKKERK